MSDNVGHRDHLYLFACHLEWRNHRNLAAYQDLLAALDDPEQYFPDMRFPPFVRVGVCPHSDNDHIEAVR